MKKGWIIGIFVMIVLIIGFILIYFYSGCFSPYGCGGEINVIKNDTLVGGCAGVQNIYWNECCDSWARENNISHAACVGNWTIENNTCSWRCGYI